MPTQKIPAQECTFGSLRNSYKGEYKSTMIISLRKKKGSTRLVLGEEKRNCSNLPRRKSGDPGQREGC